MSRESQLAELRGALDALRQLVEHTERKVYPVVRLSQREVDDLPEYSCSLPTGTTIGKRWVRRVPYSRMAYELGGIQLMGEYAECDEPGMVEIRWSLIEVLTPREAQLRDLLAPV